MVSWHIIKKIESNWLLRTYIYLFLYFKGIQRKGHQLNKLCDILTSNSISIKMRETGRWSVAASCHIEAKEVSVNQEVKYDSLFSDNMVHFYRKFSFFYYSRLRGWRTHSSEMGTRYEWRWLWRGCSSQIQPSRSRTKSKRRIAQHLPERPISAESAPKWVPRK